VQHAGVDYSLLELPLGQHLLWVLPDKGSTPQKFKREWRNVAPANARHNVFYLKDLKPGGR
jgi:hypothetical protein